MHGPFFDYNSVPSTQRYGHVPFYLFWCMTMACSGDWLGCLLVGALWGLTNPLMNKGANADVPIKADHTRRNWFTSVVSDTWRLLRNWKVRLPGARARSTITILTNCIAIAVFVAVFAESIRINLVHDSSGTNRSFDPSCCLATSSQQPSSCLLFVSQSCPWRCRSATLLLLCSQQWQQVHSVNSR